MVKHNAMRKRRDKSVRDLLKKTHSKLRKSQSKNQVDLQTLTHSKKLIIQPHSTVHVRLLQNANDSGLIGLGDTNAQLHLRWLQLITRIRDGLPAKRLEGLVGLGDFFESNPGLLTVYGPKLIVELIPRVVDDDESVRAFAIEIIQTSLLPRPQSQEISSKFCFMVRRHLFLQLKLALSNLHGIKRLDGLQLLFYILKSAPPTLFQDDSYISQIFPLVLKQLHVALRPGKRRDTLKIARTSTRRLTSFDDALEPHLCRYSPLILCCLLGSLLHMTAHSSLKTQSSTSEVQWALDTALENALQQKGNSQDYAKSELRNGGRTEISPGHGCPLFRLLDLGLGLLRVAISSVEETSKRLPVDNLTSIILLALTILNWVVAFVHVKETLYSLRLEPVVPLIAATRGTRRLCELLMATGVAQPMSICNVLQYGKNALVKTLLQLGSLLHEFEVHREMVTQEIQIFMYNLNSSTQDVPGLSSTFQAKYTSILNNIQSGHSSEQGLRSARNTFDERMLNEEKSDLSTEKSDNDLFDGVFDSVLRVNGAVSPADISRRVLRKCFPQWTLVYDEK